MKIAVRGGHNTKSTGSAALIDEVVEDRKVATAVVKYLNQLGHTAKDVSPGPMDSKSDLAYGTNQAKNMGAELFVSIHFNKCYNSYTGAIGSEIFVHSANKNATDGIIATRVVNALGAEGFKNRGVKHNDELHEMVVNKANGIPAILVEVCFVEATKDVELYKKLGADYIGKVIAQAIANKKVSSSSNTNTSTTTSSTASNNNNYVAGCKVKVKNNAVYGGCSSARGTSVPSWVIGKTYTATKFQINNGSHDGLLEGLNSWIPVNYLEIVGSTTTAQYHTVIAGDTLYSLAKKYSTTIEKIQSLNNMGTKTTLVKGQKLRVK